MKNIIIFVSFLSFIFSFGIAEAQTVKLTPSFFGSMEAREIGPAVMSGRITTLYAFNDDARLVYVGAASGGLWKSTNGGTTFKEVFKDHVQTIGAVTLNQQNKENVWVGTGESRTRNSISIGNGIYKTINGGDKWEHLGLEKTEHIAKILINPHTTDEVYVAALGDVWAPNEDRGVFKTIDGGKTWEKI